MEWRFAGGPIVARFYMFSRISDIVVEDQNLYGWSKQIKE